MGAVVETAPVLERLLRAEPGGIHRWIAGGQSTRYRDGLDRPLSGGGYGAGEGRVGAEPKVARPAGALSCALPDGKAGRGATGDRQPLRLADHDGQATGGTTGHAAVFGPAVCDGVGRGGCSHRIDRSAA